MTTTTTKKKKSFDADTTPLNAGKRPTRQDSADSISAGVPRDSKRKSGAGKTVPSSPSSTLARNGDDVKRSNLDTWQTKKKETSKR